MSTRTSPPPRQASSAPRRALVERARPVRLPIRLLARAPRRRSCCAARRPWSGFRRVYAPASPWLLAGVPRGGLSERPTPSCHSVLSDLGGRSQQAPRRSAHELATLGDHVGGGCTGALTPLGEIGDMVTDSVAGVQVAAISDRRVSLKRDRAARHALASRVCCASLL